MAQFSQAQKGKAVVPSDSASFAEGVCEQLWVGGSGTVVVVWEDNSTSSFTVSTAYPLIPVKAKRVNATGTTATNIIALY